MRGLKNFAVTFAISVLVIGLVAVFVTGALEGILISVFERDTDELTEILNSATDDVHSGGGKNDETNRLAGLSGDSYTMLLVCTDYRPSVYKYANDKSDVNTKDKDVGYLEDGFKITGARNICLVTCSKEYGEFAFTPIAPNTNVTTAAGSETLYNIYGLYGIDYFKGKIEAITGLKVDYWAVINCTDIGVVTENLGAVFCTVPCDIFTDGKEYVSATGVSRAKLKDPKAEFKTFLETCEDYIGPSCQGMLLFRDYSNGIEDELTITDSFVKGIFTNFSKLSENGCVSMWNNIKKPIDSNIDEDFFRTHYELISAYNEDVSRSLAYPGVFKAASDPDDALFEPNISRAVEDFIKYR